MKGCFTMADLNNVIFTGRLTDDPELKQLSNGSFVCHFTVACNRRKDNNGENKTDFISVAAYKTTAEIVSRNFCKGKPIIIYGELRTHTYSNKKYPDLKMNVAEVYAKSVYFAGKTKAEEMNSTAVFPIPDINEFEEITDSSLPF